MLTLKLVIQRSSHKKKRNILINALYRPPNGQIELFQTFLKQHILQIKKIKQLIPYCW